MSTPYQKLTQLFTRLSHLQHLQAMAQWDEATMMPTGGSSARNAALAELATLQHNILTQPHVADDLAAAQSQPLDDPWQQANLGWMNKHYRAATCLSPQLVHALTEKTLECEQQWRVLRPQNDWQGFAPLLKQVFELSREAAIARAEAFQMTPYDALLDQYSPGVNQALLDPIFTQLKTDLPPLIEQIVAQQPTPIDPQGPFDIAQQKAVGLQLMQAIGFDFNHGRLDISTHPFCGGVSSDVRMTTRYAEDECLTSLMGICHETGHACYEQHLPREWQHQPVGSALGMSVHESQSLLIEMQVCRSKPFIQFLAPRLKAAWGDSPAFEPDNLHRLHTTVQPGLIRVDADEVTYPLHVILRYEIERDLFNQQITINDLADVWAEKMQQALNLDTTDNYQDGVMQDVHWPSGAFGYFPAYSLGSLIAAQLFSHYRQQHPHYAQAIAAGDLQSLQSWLTQHIHARASSVSMQQLLLDATGETLSPAYFLQHVRERYL